MSYLQQQLALLGPPRSLPPINPNLPSAPALARSMTQLAQQAVVDEELRREVDARTARLLALSGLVEDGLVFGDMEVLIDAAIGGHVNPVMANLDLAPPWVRCVALSWLAAHAHIAGDRERVESYVARANGWQYSRLGSPSRFADAIIRFAAVDQLDFAMEVRRHASERELDEHAPRVFAGLAFHALRFADREQSERLLSTAISLHGFSEDFAEIASTARRLGPSKLQEVLDWTPLQAAACALARVGVEDARAATESRHLAHAAALLPMMGYGEDTPGPHAAVVFAHLLCGKTDEARELIARYVSGLDSGEVTFVDPALVATLGAIGDYGTLERLSRDPPVDADDLACLRWLVHLCVSGAAVDFGRHQEAAEYLDDVDPHARAYLDLLVARQHAEQGDLDGALAVLDGINADQVMGNDRALTILAIAQPALRAPVSHALKSLHPWFDDPIPLFEPNLLEDWLTRSAGP